MIRHQLFSEEPCSSGIAIQVTESITGCPSIGSDLEKLGLTLLQNVPSILCVETLNPKPSETVLDMCASPGNKTTHIAALMNNQVYNKIFKFLQY